MINEQRKVKYLSLRSCVVVTDNAINPGPHNFAFAICNIKVCYQYSSFIILRLQCPRYAVPNWTKLIFPRAQIFCVFFSRARIFSFFFPPYTNFFIFFPRAHEFNFFIFFPRAGFGFSIPASGWKSSSLKLTVSTKSTNLSNQIT